MNHSQTRGEDKQIDLDLILKFISLVRYNRYTASLCVSLLFVCLNQLKIPELDEKKVTQSQSVSFRSALSFCLLFVILSLSASLLYILSPTDFNQPLIAVIEPVHYPSSGVVFSSLQFNLNQSQKPLTEMIRLFEQHLSTLTQSFNLGKL